MASLYQVEQDADTPLARWRFEETSGPTFAEDVAAVTATLSGSVTPGIAPPGPYPGPGTGADFAGGYASISGVSAWRPQTIEALVLLDTVPSTGSALRPAIFMHDATSAPPLPLLMAWNIDSSHQGMLGFGYFSSGSYKAISMGSALSTGVLHHIVGVYDGTTGLTIYVDGTSVASGTVTARGTLTGVSGTGHIGRRYDGSAQIDGRLYDLALYNGGLSAGRVSAHYTASQQLAGLQLTGGGVWAWPDGTVQAAGAWAGPVSGGGSMAFTSPTRGVGAPSVVKFTPHPGDYA